VISGKPNSYQHSANFTPQNLRKRILDLAISGNTGHIGCAFSLVEILSTLYEKELIKFNPNNPEDPKRDRLVLSKGHGAMAIYACLLEIGFLNEDDVKDYFNPGSRLFGLVEETTPGIEVNAGSLGHGIAVAVGMAHALNLKNDPAKVVCIVGDGEINEGSVWEAIFFAAHHKISNLTVVVDANGYQAMGISHEVLSMEPMKERFQTCGFFATECDGHNREQIEAHLKNCFQQNLPSCLVARTKKGAGVDFMQKDNIWHYQRLETDELKKAAYEQVEKFGGAQ
jgi:transketolase